MKGFIVLPSLVPILLFPAAIGFKNQRHIVVGRNVTKYANGNPNGYDKTTSCSSLSELPFLPLLSIGLRDKYGNPMVCSGIHNPHPTTCYLFDSTNKTWSRGPNLKRSRVSSTVTCLDSGICWIFGGKRKSTTEWYNPDTGTFQLGPKMPIRSIHGLCSALGPISGLIYIVARRDIGSNRAYTFNPKTREFKILELLGEEKKYAACGVMPYTEENCDRYGQKYRGSENFIVTTGGVKPYLAMNTTYIFNSYDQKWVRGPDCPQKLFGAIGRVSADKTQFIVSGGRTINEKVNLDSYSLSSRDVFRAVAWSTHLNTTAPGRTNGKRFQVEANIECTP